MSVLSPKSVLLAFFAAALALVTASACGGSEFSSADAGGSSGRGGSTSAGGNGTGATNGKSCVGPEECDDGDACTTDLCSADGTCATSPRCGGTERCCGGTCAECCGNDDCDDGLACTENRCFMGQCMYVPNDAECASGTEYCASGQGCRPKQPCGLLPGEDAVVTCADEDPCTTDSCGVDNFCSHDYCATEAGTLCCEGVGCAEECCTDAQCDTDLDPCTVGSCEGGKCSRKPRCESGQCCPDPDGKGATCGECCGRNDCDDKAPCTVDECLGGQCSHTPTECQEPGFYCDPTEGCIQPPDCQDASDCEPSGCQTAECSAGVCKFTNCAAGTKCCSSGSGAQRCAVCCSASECSDNIACTVDECGAEGCTHTPKNDLCLTGQTCDPKLGCIECTSAAQCDDQVPCTKDTCVNNKCFHTKACSGSTPYCGETGCVACLSDSDCHGGIIINPPQEAAVAGCENTRCVDGTCKTTYAMCDIGFCCAPYGCMAKGCLQ